MRRVVVTGLGAVTPLGVANHVTTNATGVKRTWTRLLQGECGIVSTRPLGDEFRTLPSQVAGLVPVPSPEDTEKETKEGLWRAEDHLSPTEVRQTAKFAQYALAASSEALTDAGYSPSTNDLPNRETTGVTLGSGIGNLSDLYDTSLAYSRTKNYRKIHPLFVPRLLINLGAAHISMRYGFQGPNHAATTACTTGAHSIGDAARFIMMGDADVMIAGGAESCIHPLAIGGFARSRSLVTSFNDSPEKSSRPFDQDRAGFAIGEGTACLVLEEYEHAKSRSARIYAELVGYGNSADAHHLTAPLEDGHGAYLAMKKALEQASIPPSQVDYINAHATSTPLGDKAENQAIKSLMLGEHGRSAAGNINVSSTKGAIGHLLGAAGAIEALFTVLAIHQNVMPPTINLISKSAEFDCNYVANEAQQHQISVAITNSFGFGGTNSSLCFKKCK